MGFIHAGPLAKILHACGHLQNQARETNDLQQQKHLELMLERSLGLVSKVRENKVNNFNSLMAKLSQTKGASALAFLLLEKMKQQRVPPDAITYTSLMHSVVQSGGNLDEMFTVFGFMDRDNLKPTLYFLQVLMNACVAQNNTRRAFALLEYMKDHGITPNQVTYGTLMGLCAKNRDFGEAFSLMDKMSEAKVGPTLANYTLLLKYIVESDGPLEKAFDVVKSMLRHGVVKPNVLVFSSLVAACAKKRDINGSFAVLRLMESAGVAPDNILFSHMIDQCGRSGDWPRIVDLLTQMTKHNIAPDVITYSSLINSLSQGGHLEQASQLLQMVKALKFPLSATLYTPLIKGYGRQGDTSGVAKLLDDMRREGLQLDDIVHMLLANYNMSHLSQR